MSSYYTGFQGNDNLAWLSEELKKRGSGECTVLPVFVRYIFRSEHLKVG